ncbi:hypothetical protein GCM10009837_63170 [Streptomyces durmitorensis]|uniref:Lipoprotein n=1 Tax=Streptomyces durmitorensis TaxID=319947 RepID=A0ABY4PTQ6_9ACTN|nr:hypothetical protein [Streptomyces durmitorensis]UQT56457.1 hypothetical protein M4V62_15880 [Streptomyces durmitorensis]
MSEIPLVRRTRRTALVSAVCAGLVIGVTGLTGCSSEEDPDAGTNGMGKLSAAKIQSKSRAAADSATAVRLSGTLVSKGHTYKLDMRLKDEGGTGSVTSKGETFQLLRVGKQLFLKADSAFWTHEDAKGGQKPGKADGAAAAKLDGKYVKVPQEDASYQQLSGFTDKDVLLAGMLTLHGELATGDRGTTSGNPSIEITGDKGAGGTLDVSLKGKPYPLSLERAGDAGTLRLSDWGRDFPLSEPDKDEMVDYGEQLPES